MISAAHMRNASFPLTKIIATIGPASSEPVVVGKLIEAGVSVFRLNFSHGTMDEHSTRVETIRTLSAEMDTPVAILGDLPGPKIRLGPVQNGGIDLESGNIVAFGDMENAGGATDAAIPLTCTYPEVFNDVQPGERVLINDGAVRLLAIDRAPGGAVLCRVTLGGRVSTGKGVNFPESTLRISAITARDLELARWACAHQLDYLGLSFVRTAEEVRTLRETIDEWDRDGDKQISIIAKIEQPRAVEGIDSILEASDAIMIARGDLGVEMELTRVPAIQKQLIQKAREFGKPCIVATQMLESMIESPTPTRAEMNDIANAIFDEVDAVMLSGETAVGRYPVLAVEYMRQVALQSEVFISKQLRHESAPTRLTAARNRTAALAHGVWVIANDVDARLIVVWSQRGGGARLLSQNNFCVPIIAISSDHAALRQMQLLRGVVPVHMEPPATLAEWTRRVDHLLLSTRWCRPGDQTLLVAGSPLQQVGNTNAIAVHEVGSTDTGFARA